MSLHAWASTILRSSDLQDKLAPFSAPLSLDLFSSAPMNFARPALPARATNMQFSPKQIKFPKSNTLHQKENLAIALHAFANHELLAIELMALALLILPEVTPQQQKWKIGILQSLHEEQTHFQMYVERMKECGHDFGAFPVSGFFWDRAGHFKSFEEYSATMSLTLEGANLDFASYYSRVFAELGDHSTAAILNKVLEDEIGHVAFGVRLLNKLKGDKFLFEYYQSLLPFPLTPARARGIDFQSQLRRKAGLDDSFIQDLANFDDDFRITKRRDS
jgi:uncharacterized ferritin-like protein (DUF455 family)